MPSLKSAVHRASLWLYGVTQEELDEKVAGTRRRIKERERLRATDDFYEGFGLPPNPDRDDGTHPERGEG